MSTTISGDTGVDKATNQAVKDAMGVTGDAPIFGCRAWVNFDGTRNESDTGASVVGQNVKIRASGNVSSVVKNAVGDYTVNFTTAMPDVNYCPTDGQGRTDTVLTAMQVRSMSVSSFNFQVHVGSSNALVDNIMVFVAVFR